MLKYITDQVPGELEQYYEPTDNGQYKLKVEGVVAETEFRAVKEKEKEFRESNITLKRQMETVTGIFGEGEKFDPKKLDEKINALVEPRLNSKLEEFKKAKEDEVTALRQRLQEADGTVYKLVLSNEVSTAAAKHGVLGSAIEDVTYRAKESFVVENGQVKFKEDKLGADGKPITIDNWMAELANKAPHLFERSKGTDARKNNGTGVITSNKPLSNIDMISSGLNSLDKGSSNKSLHK